MPAWQGSERRSELPPDWTARRKRVLRRAGGQCEERDPQTNERCQEVATDCDHIKPGGDHSESNLRALCAWHHQQKSSREGAAARAAKYRKNAKKFRRTEEHPGAL
jgi:hypothetical protein